VAFRVQARSGQFEGERKPLFSALHLIASPRAQALNFGPALIQRPCQKATARTVQCRKRAYEGEHGRLNQFINLFIALSEDKKVVESTSVHALSTLYHIWFSRIAIESDMVKWLNG
jgi:hypothetical protein